MPQKIRDIAVLWRDIPGFEGFYEVSSDGDVRAKDRVVDTMRGPRRYRARPVQSHTNSHGYLIVHLSVGGVRSHVQVHRAVAMAFVDGYDDELDVNHLNGIKTDNRAENLEWCSRSVNLSHAYKSGLKRAAVYSADKNSNFRGTIIAQKEGLEIEIKGAREMVALGLCPANVYACLAGKRNSYHGYTFRRDQNGAKN